MSGRIATCCSGWVYDVGDSGDELFVDVVGFGFGDGCFLATRREFYSLHHDCA